MSQRSAANEGSEPSLDRLLSFPDQDDFLNHLSSPCNVRLSESARVEIAAPMGAETLLYLNTGATNFIARVKPTDRFHVGQSVRIEFDLTQAHLFDASTESVI